MNNSDLVRIAVIGAVALALYYVVTSQTAIPNQGSLSTEPEMPEVSESYQQPPKSGLPSFNPATNQQQFAQQQQLQIAQQQVAQAQQGQLNKSMPSNYANPAQEPSRANQLNVVKQNENVLPYPQISNNYGPQQANVAGQFDVKLGTQPSLDCYPKDTVTPQDLMPKEDPYNTWSKVNPTVGGHLSDRNFLESGALFGIDTQSSSLKNPNLQLRSDPVIAQVAVGPWSQSTYGPDTNRRQFEVGGDY